MSLEQAINDNTAAVRDLIAALANGAPAAGNNSAAPAAEEKKGRGRPPKEKTEAAPEAKQPDPPAEEDPFADASDPVPEKTYTTDDVRKALIDLSKKDKPKATSILAGCTNKDGKPAASIGEILPADYARVVKDATEALK
jgi:hypothetical protein